MVSLEDGPHGSPILFLDDYVELLVSELRYDIVMVLFLKFDQFLLDMYEFVAIYFVILT